MVTFKDRGIKFGHFALITWILIEWFGLNHLIQGIFLQKKTDRTNRCFRNKNEWLISELLLILRRGFIGVCFCWCPFWISELRPGPIVKG